MEFEKNDWGDPVYYVNGDKTKAEELKEIVETMQTQAGEPFSEQILPVNEENIKQKVDLSPSENELSLWQP